MRLLILCLLVFGALSISGCVGITSPTDSTTRPKQGPPGTGASISVSPPSINFGSVAVGSNVSQSITLSNMGKSPVSITQERIAVPGFAVSGMSLPMTLGAGKQATMEVVFSPRTVGSASGAVFVKSNASGSPAIVSVSGTGVSRTSRLNASSGSLNFGNIAVGDSGVLGVTLTNAGNSAVYISNISISGAGLTASGVPAGEILQPGQSATVNVAFAPIAPGHLAGSVTIVSNATNSPAVIPLGGYGFQAHSHSATLTWTDSTPAVTGYNVYRSTESAGQYTRLNSSAITGTSYRDSTVLPEHIYYYEVTSLESGSESAPSSPVAAVIPDS